MIRHCVEILSSAYLHIFFRKKISAANLLLLRQNCVESCAFIYSKVIDIYMVVYDMLYLFYRKKNPKMRSEAQFSAFSLFVVILTALDALKSLMCALSIYYFSYIKITVLQRSLVHCTFVIAYLVCENTAFDLL